MVLAAWTAISGRGAGCGSLVAESPFFRRRMLSTSHFTCKNRVMPGFFAKTVRHTVFSIKMAGVLRKRLLND
jgi:hypothetical protein